MRPQSQSGNALDKLILQETPAVVELNRYDNGVKAEYCFIACTIAALDRLYANMPNPGFRVEDYANVICRGEGEPSTEVLDYMKTYYGYEPELKAL